MWSKASTLSPQGYAAPPESKMYSLAVGSLQWLVYMAMNNACKAASYLRGMLLILIESVRPTASSSWSAACLNMGFLGWLELQSKSVVVCLGCVCGNVGVFFNVCSTVKKTVHNAFVSWRYPAFFWTFVLLHWSLLCLSRLLELEQWKMWEGMHAPLS